MAGRDSQDVSLPVIKPTSANVRDSQDVSLPITKPTSAKVRDSQDVSLPITKPTSALVRLSQDVTLVIIKNQTPIVQKMIFGEEWDERIPQFAQTFGMQSVEVDSVIGPLTYYTIHYTST